MTPERSGRNNFDALRMAMALAVVWSHSFALYFGSEANEPVSRLMNGVTNAGRVAVYVFFVISGYLISQSFARSPSAWQFLRKRVARIYPGYLAAALICVFVIVPLYAPGQAETPRGMLAMLWRLLLLQDWFATPAFLQNPIRDLNGSMWTIPYEVGCYLAVLALGLLRLRPAHQRVLCLALLGLAIVRHVLCEFDGTLLGLARQGPTVIPCFLAGACAYLYRQALSLRPSRALLGVLLLVASTHLPATAGAVLFDVLTPLVTAYATLVLAFATPPLMVTRFGDLSYGTYLYAFPIQQMVKATVGTMAFPLYLALVTLLSVTCGALSWHLVERWFRIRPVATADRGVRSSGAQGRRVATEPAVEA